MIEITDYGFAKSYENSILAKEFKLIYERYILILNELI